MPFIQWKIGCNILVDFVALVAGQSSLPYSLYTDEWKLMTKRILSAAEELLWGTLMSVWA